MMALAILTFVMFSVYDVQQVASTRVRTQNACDAAALAGARWQVSALNAIGELNLLKVTTAIIDMPPSPYIGPVPMDRWIELYNGLDQLQFRLSVLGPWLGVYYGEKAARLNGLQNVPSFENDIRQHAARFRQDPRDWVSQDLAKLVEAIADQGVAARPWGTDNWNDLMSQLDFDGATAITSQLFNASFYQAIMSYDWCYLYHAGFYQAPSYDCTYGSATTSWGQITFSPTNAVLAPYLKLCVERQPILDPAQLGNSEPVMQNLVNQRNLQYNPNFPVYTGDTNYPHFFESPALGWVPLDLYTYTPQYWNWNGRRPDDENQTVLLRSPFKTQFQYEGADSHWDVMTRTRITMTPANSDQVSWTSASEQGGLRTAFSLLQNWSNHFGVIQSSAAAKPFGQVDETTPPNGTPGSSIPVVLPVFTDVRLVPLAFSSATAQFDPLMWGHLQHLDPYTHYGISAISANCPYCAALIMWENQAFRDIGTAWLKAMSKDGTVDPCPPPPPGGGGGGGAPGISPF